MNGLIGCKTVSYSSGFLHNLATCGTGGGCCILFSPCCIIPCKFGFRMDNAKLERMKQLQFSQIQLCRSGCFFPADGPLPRRDGRLERVPVLVLGKPRPRSRTFHVTTRRRSMRRITLQQHNMRKYEAHLASTTKRCKKSLHLVEKWNELISRFRILENFGSRTCPQVSKIRHLSR